MCAFSPATIPAGTFNGGTVTDPLVVDSSSTSATALTVDSGGASAPIASLRKSNGDPIFYVHPGTTFPGGVAPTLYVNRTDVSIALGAGNGFNVGGTGGNTNLFVDSTGAVQIQPPPGSTDTPLSIKTEGNSGALEVDRFGASTFGFLARFYGALIAALNTVPADGTLAAGECALWFDATNGVGNTKLMCKGKSLDGTVKTATVAVLA